MVCHKQVVQGILHKVPPEIHLIRYLIIRKLIIIIGKNPSLSIEKPLEFPQNYPHQINLLLPVIHNFQKMAKIQGILFLFDVKLSCPAKTLLNKKKGDSLWLILHQIPTS